MSSICKSVDVAVNGVCVRRCFLCGTTLRDPGVPYFACGACGAQMQVRGAEPGAQFTCTECGAVNEI